MNEKEVAEIRRNLNPKKTNITHIRGCYVNQNKEIISQFNQSIALMPEAEGEKLLSILKRTLSGTLQKNLIDIEFTTQQVLESAEHKLLMSLKSSELKDDDATNEFCKRAISALSFDGNYLILLAHDKYDVPYRTSVGDKLADASSEVFSYFLCAVCPVKMTKPALSYYPNDNEFRSCTLDWIVSPPDIGFMFPAFDDRSANIYNALYYSKDCTQSNKDFVDSIFNSEIPLPATVQKETFQAILEDTLVDDCSYGIMQAVHEQFYGMIEEHKENKEVTPLIISKSTVKEILKTCGVSEDSVATFDKKYDSNFGQDAPLTPRNIIDTKQFEVRTPTVKIQVDPDRTNLVETRIIDGAKYILIRVEEGIEVNGVSVNIS